MTENFRELQRSGAAQSFSLPASHNFAFLSEKGECGRQRESAKLLSGEIPGPRRCQNLTELGIKV